MGKFNTRKIAMGLALAVGAGALASKGVTPGMAQLGGGVLLNDPVMIGYGLGGLTDLGARLGGISGGITTGGFLGEAV